MNYTQAQIDRANAVSLEDFLRTQGETLIKSGREYRWKEHDSLTVRGNKWFRHSQSKGGYPIDFVMEFYGKSFPEAVQLLTGESAEGQSEASTAPPTAFHLPLHNRTADRAIQYLCESRGLNKTLVEAFLLSGDIYEDAKRHNVVFVGRDRNGTPRYAHVRGTADTFRQDITGSDKSYPFRYEGNSNQLFVFEAPIQELYEMVSNAFADEDKNAVPRVIAVVRRTIDSKELLGDADHFHNLGTALASQHYTKEAVGICELGLTHFPNNMDLISCLTLYNAEIGDFKSAEIYAKKLHEFDRSVWNWRAYTFYIDYCNYLPGTDVLKKSTLECVADYQAYLPTEEKAYMAAYETYVKYGMHNEAIDALKTAHNTLKVTPQCSTRLANHYLAIGEYELCIEAASKALVGNAKAQASV